MKTEDNTALCLREMAIELSLCAKLIQDISSNLNRGKPVKPGLLRLAKEDVRDTASRINELLNKIN
jgi:hypothetical protein